jgi:PPOX class probable F420-dependent enzyme
MAELPAEARELLTARNVAHMAVLMSNGAPQVAPVWITLVGGRPAIFSEKENLRVRNLRRDGRIAVSVADEHNPYRAVLIRGHVSDELGGDEAVAIMDEMSNRDVGSDYPVRTAIVFVIEPDKVTFLDLPPVPSG